MRISTAPVLLSTLFACSAASKAPETPPEKAPEKAPEPAATDGRFRYDATTGACVDGAGRAGLNAAVAATLFVRPDDGGNTYPGGDGECVDFTGFDFSEQLGMAYPTLAGWNLRGARFKGAKFVFANITDADLRGADLREISIGYSQIEGTGDSHTQVHAACKVSDGFTIYCQR